MRFAKSVKEVASWQKKTHDKVRLVFNFKDYERARQIYQFCLNDVIPHEKFTFGKIWILCAEFEIRRNNLDKAKSIFGLAIGKTKKKKC